MGLSAIASAPGLTNASTGRAYNPLASFGVHLPPVMLTVRLLQILVKIKGNLVVYQIPAISAT
ncbi:MAG: hypothetical protein LH702_08715 [Phormidesmis sp. CAN_BIN44]|nr:hypothetical protein [Phormidesmis sp. CAN_BIN44]